MDLHSVRTTPTLIWVAISNRNQLLKFLFSGFSEKIPGYPRYSMIGDRSYGIFNLRIQNASLEDDAEFQCQVGPAKNSDPIRTTANLTVICEYRNLISTMGTLPLNNPGEFFGSLNCANKALICSVHGVCPYVNRILCQHHKLMFAHTKLVTFSRRTIVCYTRQQTLLYDVCDLTGFTFPPPQKRQKRRNAKYFVLCTAQDSK